MDNIHIIFWGSIAFIAIMVAVPLFLTELVKSFYTKKARTSHRILMGSIIGCLVGYAILDQANGGAANWQWLQMAIGATLIAFVVPPVLSNYIMTPLVEKDRPICPSHCDATITTHFKINLKVLMKPIKTRNSTVRAIPQKYIRSQIHHLLKYEFAAFVEEGHFDRCWIMVALNRKGKLIALLPAGDIDWRGGFRHEGTEKALKQAFKAGAYRLLSQEYF